MHIDKKDMNIKSITLNIHKHKNENTIYAQPADYQRSRMAQYGVVLYGMVQYSIT